MESVDQIVERAEKAINWLGDDDRVLLTPDCGFAAVADNPVTSVATAKRKLATIADTPQEVCFLGS